MSNQLLIHCPHCRAAIVVRPDGNGGIVLADEATGRVLADGKCADCWRAVVTEDTGVVQQAEGIQCSTR